MKTISIFDVMKYKEVYKLDDGEVLSMFYGYEFIDIEALIRISCAYIVREAIRRSFL